MKKQALVLFSYRNHRFGYIEMLFSRLSERAAGHDIELTRGSLSDLRISIRKNRLSITESLSKRRLDSFDVVYFELWYKAQQQALAAAQYLQRKKVPYFSKELATVMPLTKVGELAVMANHDIPLPDTFMSSHRELKKAFRRQTPPFAYPFVLKAADGYGGNNNHLVYDYEQLCSILDDNRSVIYVAQQFIPNDCDYRCLVFGGQIRLVLQRTRATDSKSHLNNTSAGAEGRLVATESISSEARDAVLRAAAVLGREQFAGVDLMIHKDTGQPYILEVNQTPQIEIGAEIEEKIDSLLTYMKELAHGK